MLKSKDQVLSVFKEFQARAERESAQKLKVVQTDNNGEYRGQFEEYYKAQSIQIEYTIPKSPELNGLAERMDQTIMERVRSMLSRAKLMKSYWAEAMCTIVYMINMSPLVQLKGDVPLRVWTRKEVFYRYLRVFRCLVYMHIMEMKTKLKDFSNNLR